MEIWSAEKRMVKLINFTKMQAGGNDFVVLDNRKKFHPENYSQLAKKMCINKFSVGADGLLILENLAKKVKRNTHFQMRYFNPDGSEANFCGNGASCLALFAYEKKIAPAKMNFLSKSGLVSAMVKNGKVKLKMTNPQRLNLDFTLDIDGKKYLLSFINTGVPHTVNFIREIDKIDVQKLGKIIRFHQFFQPDGTNVNFVQVKDKNTISIRTYERGVEDETLSCGTGAVASAIIAGVKNLVKPPVGADRPPVKVLTQSGETLKVYYQIKNNQIDEVYLENSPKIVYTGEIEV